MQTSFKYWAERFIEAEKNEVKPNTLKEYVKVKNHLVQEFDGLDLNDITPKRVQELLDNLHLNGKAKSTINKRKYLIQQIFRYANVQGVEVLNPCSFVKAPRMATKSTRRSLTKAEIENVLLYRNYESCGLYAFCLLYTGMRRSELLAVQWEDVDFENNRIHVCKVINFLNNRASIEYSLKNGNKERYIPMPRVLADTLKKHKGKKKGFVFVNNKELLFNETEHNRAWNKYREETKMEVTQHMFRHTYATMLFDAKVDIKTASYLLGHNDERTTLSIYTHLEKERATAGAIQKLDDYINSH